MKPLKQLVLYLFAVIVAAGCASTKITEHKPLVSGKLPRPNNIWVYDFVATPGDFPENSDVDAQSEEQTPEQIAMGRQLGEQIAGELVTDINRMGLPARKVKHRASPDVDDLVIRGYLVSMRQGSETKRLVFGFDSGATELKTEVEAFQMTSRGLRKLGSGTVESGGNKTPGGTAPAAVALASGNPLGLIVTSSLKIYGEASGSSKLEGRAKQTADEIAEKLRTRFEEQDWIG